jgi:arylsulfatase A-like enzyme
VSSNSSYLRQRKGNAGQSCFAPVSGLEQTRRVQRLELSPLSVTGMLALLVLAACHARLEFEPPRSIILISLDTLRADYLNLYGYRDYETSPILDAFAEESVVFDNCVVSEPRTLTSHMSLFTGLHPQHHGVDEEVRLPARVRTLAESLRAAGLTTRGYADGGYVHSRWGFDRGFGVYEGNRKRGLAESLPRVTGWLEEPPADPFFLFLHTYDVHNYGKGPFYRVPPPIRGLFSDGIDSVLAGLDPEETARRIRAHGGRPSEVDTRYIRATYAEGVRYVDESLGRLFAFLKERGLYDRALIIVWSDHGEGLYDHKSWTHGELYDHTTRCALIMKFPGGIAEGRRIRAMVSAIDIMPTLLELIGAEAPTRLDGRSFLDRIRYDRGDGYAFSVRAKSGNRLFSIRTPDHHLLWSQKADRFEFFNLRADPTEQRNLYPSESPVQPELEAKLRDWVAQHDRAREQLPRERRSWFDPQIREQLRALGYLN